MIPSLQPSRPKVNTPRQQKPLNQQPRAHYATLTGTTPSLPAQSQTQAQTDLFQHPQSHIYPQHAQQPPPRTQLEAMPPQSPPRAAPSQHPTYIPPHPSSYLPIPFDASKRHPVFFTERLKRPPSGVGAGASVSPVAMGYVFDRGVVKDGVGRVKL